MDAIAELDSLIEKLAANDQVAQPRATDAIDRELGAQPRRTTAESLRDSEVMIRFRQELTDGLIKADTVATVLRLLREVLPRILSGKA